MKEILKDLLDEISQNYWKGQKYCLFDYYSEQCAACIHYEFCKKHKRIIEKINQLEE